MAIKGIKEVIWFKQKNREGILCLINMMLFLMLIQL